MNTHIQNLAMISAVLTFSGCHSNTHDAQTGQSVNTETVLAESKSQKETEMRTVTGIVKNIFYGKDGYVASIFAKDNQQYFATISRANLKNPQQYRSFNVNDTVTVKGDYWEIDDENQITVREIQ